MKIGYVLKRFPRFSETFVLNEILALERLGVTVEVFSLMPPPQEPRHETFATLRAPVFYLPKSGVVEKYRIFQGDAQAARSLPEVLDPAVPLSAWFPGKQPREAAHLTLQAAGVAMLASARGIEHLHAHFASNATTAALLAARLAGIGYSFTAHARDIFHTYVDPATDDALRYRKIAEADFVVTVSEYNRTHLLRITGGRYGDKIHRIYNGVDLRRFRPARRSEHHPHRFVAVGRLVEKKGFRYLVEACHHLQRSGLNYQCLIVGDGPEREALSHRIGELALTDRVQLLGSRSQAALREILADGGTMVLPAVIGTSGDRDGLPTVLLEAMAMALPVISTRVAGIPEIVVDGETGRLVPEKDPRLLAEAMAEMLRDPERARTWGEQGRKRAEALFDLDRNVSRLYRYFEKAVAQRRKEQTS